MKFDFCNTHFSSRFLREINDSYAYLDDAQS
jgi:hypothetical protein